MSAKETLQAAQSLYEEKKLLSYPRTDSRHLSAEVAATLPRWCRRSGALRGPARPGHRASGRSRGGSSTTPGSPTTTPSSPRGLGRGPVALARRAAALRPRLPAAAHGLARRARLLRDHRDHARARRRADPVVDRFHSSGTAVDQSAGRCWSPRPRRAARGTSAPGPDGADGRGRRGTKTQALPPGLTAGRAVAVVDAEAVAKRTRPPRRFTDATLLTAMETAGRTLDDRELAEAMKERGLGTPATRAEIIETLVRRGYVERQARALAATEKGIGLVERVHPDVKSPALTGEWEAELRRIERAQADLGGFMRRIEAHVRDAGAGHARRRPARTGPPTTAPAGRARLGACLRRRRHGPLRPLPPRLADLARRRSSRHRHRSRPSAPPLGLAPRLTVFAFTVAARRTRGEAARRPRPARRSASCCARAFRLEAFRPRQEAVCRAVAEGKDVLLVMPTGAGKSLCYQLPGLARGGTTLVVSPLIALMEDQVAKLQALGLRAERIHSGRDRGALARRRWPPTRTAVSTSCSWPRSVWACPASPRPWPGARPRSWPWTRRTASRNGATTSGPTTACSAAACPSCGPLPSSPSPPPPRPASRTTSPPSSASSRCASSTVSAARTSPSRWRAWCRRCGREAVGRLLADPRAGRPSSIPPPGASPMTLGAALSREFPAAAYHAGMTTSARDRVQADFLAGRLEVIVATIAFGMGVDKPDIRTVVHTALPGTLEGFSQEIGRAGRDGKPSRAVLLHSWNDRRTHEFFFEKGYPDPEVLERVFRALGPEPSPRTIWPGGCASIPRSWRRPSRSSGSTGARGSRRRVAGSSWPVAARLARAVPAAARAPAGAARPDAALRRRPRLPDGRAGAPLRRPGGQGPGVRHCATCATPRACLVRTARAPKPKEREAATAVLEALRDRDGQATGRLHAECGSAGLERRDFEEVLGGLARAGLLRVTADTFTKDGRVIPFKRAWLTPQARGASLDPIEFALAEEARRSGRVGCQAEEGEAVEGEAGAQRGRGRHGAGGRAQDVAPRRGQAGRRPRLPRPPRPDAPRHSRRPSAGRGRPARGARLRPRPAQALRGAAPALLPERLLRGSTGPLA